MSGLVSKVAPGIALIGALSIVGYTPPVVAEAGDWVLRAGVSSMQTDSNSETFSTISRSGIRLDDDTSATFTAAYFFADTVALELTTGLPYQHELRGNRRLKDLGIDKIADVKSVSTSLGLQFYLPNKTRFRPYAGLGGSYTAFYDEEMKVGGLDVDLEGTLDCTLIVGTDMALTKNLLLNVDARYIDIDTTAKFSGAIEEDIELEVDPFIYTIGLGYRF